MWLNLGDSVITVLAVLRGDYAKGGGMKEGRTRFPGRKEISSLKQKDLHWDRPWEGNSPFEMMAGVCLRWTGVPGLDDPTCRESVTDASRREQLTIVSFCKRL